MSFREKYREQAEQLLQDAEQEQQQRDQETGYGSYFLKDKIPQGIPFWKCGEGQHIIDIIPWHTGEDHPKGAGKLAYSLVLWVHQNIGVLKDHFVCQSRAYKIKDPMCDYLAKGRLPKDEYDAIRAKQRNIYLIWCHDTPAEEAKGIQIWEIAHFFMGKKLDVISKIPKGGGIVPFWDIDNGKSVVWERQGSGVDNTEFVGHRFMDREEPIPDEILDKTFAIDSIIKWKSSYEEQYEAFYGKPYIVGEGEVPETPPKDEKPITVQPTKEKPAKEEKAEEPAKEEPVKEEKTEEPTAEAPPTEEPAKVETTTQEGDNKCPANYVFGVDIDTKPECNGCPVWDECSDEADLLEEKKKESKGRLIA